MDDSPVKVLDRKREKWIERSKLREESGKVDRAVKNVDRKLRKMDRALKVEGKVEKGG